MYLHGCPLVWLPPERLSNPCTSFANNLDGQRRLEPLSATGLAEVQQVKHCLQGALMHSKIQYKEKQAGAELCQARLARQLT